MIYWSSFREDKFGSGIKVFENFIENAYSRMDICMDFSSPIRPCTKIVNCVKFHEDIFEIATKLCSKSLHRKPAGQMDGFWK